MTSSEEPEFVGNENLHPAMNFNFGDGLNGDQTNDCMIQEDKPFILVNCEPIPEEDKIDFKTYQQDLTIQTEMTGEDEVCDLQAMQRNNKCDDI